MELRKCETCGQGERMPESLPNYHCWNCGTRYGNVCKRCANTFLKDMRFCPCRGTAAKEPERIVTKPRLKINYIMPIIGIILGLLGVVGSVIVFLKS